jgi:hypothetical protein
MLMRVAVFVLMALSPISSANEAATTVLSPRVGFKDLVKSLQETPDDNDLREKIIKLALTLKPKPKMPEDLDEIVGQGTQIMKDAKGLADYQDAVKAFQNATTLAPWVADGYFNLSVAQEKAGKPLDAVASLKLYLLASPDAKDASDVRQKIGALKYVADKAAKDAAGAAARMEAEKERNSPAGAQRLFNSLNGKQFFCHEKLIETGAGRKMNRTSVVIRPNGFELGDEIKPPEAADSYYEERFGDEPVHQRWLGNISGRRISLDQSERSNFYEIAQDGNSVVHGFVWKDSRGEQIYETCRPH